MSKMMRALTGSPKMKRALTGSPKMKRVLTGMPKMIRALNGLSKMMCVLRPYGGVAGRGMDATSTCGKVAAERYDWHSYGALAAARDWLRGELLPLRSRADAPPADWALACRAAARGWLRGEQHPLGSLPTRRL